MTEIKIGNIRIVQPDDADSRSFSDAAETAEILRLLTEEPPEEYSRLIDEKKSWAYLLHLSHIRRNVIRPLPFSGDERILEIGAGCGTLTGFLAEKAGEVTGIEPSAVRCRINAVRNGEHDNIRLLAMTCAEAEEQTDGLFDAVVWIDAPFDAREDEGLRMTPGEKTAYARRHLKAGGRLILGVDNRLGMRFLAGEKEEYTGRYFAGAEGYPAEETAWSCTKAEWEVLLKEQGMDQAVFYYPYPDHRFAMQIYTDEWLPHMEELNLNYRNFAKKRMALFDDDAVWRTLLENGLFSAFSNSFLITACRGED